MTGYFWLWIAVACYAASGALTLQRLRRGVDQPRAHHFNRAAMVAGFLAQTLFLLQRGHAIANGLPVLACNRTGLEPSPEHAGRGIRFWGSSFVAGPQGELVAQAGTDQPQLLRAQVDLARSESVRRIWPFLRDRRIDAYDDLLKRYRD